MPKKSSKCKLNLNESDLGGKRGTRVWINEFWYCLLKIDIKNIPEREK